MIKYTENASLRPYNTFGLNAKASLLVEYTAEEDLPLIFADADCLDIPNTSASLVTSSPLSAISPFNLA